MKIILIAFNDIVKLKSQLNLKPLSSTDALKSKHFIKIKSTCKGKTWKKLLSTCPGQVDYLLRKLLFLLTCPLGKAPEKTHFNPIPMEKLEEDNVREKKWEPDFFPFPSHCDSLLCAFIFPLTNLCIKKTQASAEERRLNLGTNLWQYLVSVKCSCFAVVLFLNGHVCSEIWLRLEECFCLAVPTNLISKK